jgi:hypothetical protein
MDLGQGPERLETDPWMGVLNQFCEGFQSLGGIGGGVSLGSDRGKQQRAGEDESAEHAETIEREGLHLQASAHQKSELRMIIVRRGKPEVRVLSS